MRHVVKTFGAGALLAASLAGLSACGGGGGGGGSKLVTSELARADIGAAGGALSVSDTALAGASIDIPAGALATTTTVTLSLLTGNTGLDADALLAEFGPTGTMLAAPATVTIPYDTAYLTANGITDASTLKIVEMIDGEANRTLVTTAQDDTAHLITANADSFGRFVVLGYSNASLKGTYRVADFYYDVSAPHGIMPATGAPLPTPLGFTSDALVLTFDGIGSFTLQGRQNRDGTGTRVLEAGSYQVSPDGSVEIGYLSGAVLAGGSMLVLETLTSGRVPQIIVGMKSGGAVFNDASLSGDYRVVNYSFALDAIQDLAPVPGDVLPSPRGLTSEVLTCSFDGAGGYTLSGMRNRDGDVSAVSRTGSYSVAADGTLTMDDGQGGVLAGGSGFVLGDRQGNPMVMTGMRIAAGGSPAGLKGRYKVAVYHMQASTSQNPAPAVGGVLPSVLGVTGMLLTATFDGAGNYVVDTGVSNLDGSLDSVTFTGTYTVAPDGATVFGNMSGQLLAGGSAFVLAATSGDPWIVVGILQ